MTTPTPATVASALTTDKTHLPAASLSRVTPKTRDKAAKAGEAMKDGCLSGDTLVATLDGPQRIDALLGRVTLLTDYGWITADVECFGVDRLYALTFVRGNERVTVHATASHRWMLVDGSWATTDVLNDACKSNTFRPAKSDVARQAQQPAHATSRVAVIDVERRPFGLPVGSKPLRPGHTAAESTAPALFSRHTLEVAGTQAVLHAQSTFTTSQPSIAADNDRISNFTRFTSSHDTELAFGPVALVPGIEVGVWTRLAADTAHDVADVLDQDALGVFPLAHVGNRTPDWKLIEVSNTERYELVYCAVVPNVHRFVLASGILTGNSFPIRDGADLKRAINAFGRAKDKGAAKRHIMRRAKALDKVDLLPDSWKALALKEFPGQRLEPELEDQLVDEPLVAAASPQQPVLPLDAALTAKAERHNSVASDDRRVSVAKLKLVYRRGVADFGERPCVTPDQHGHARVNSFLALLATGAPLATTYTSDNDLLPQGHPLAPPPFATRPYDSKV